MYIQAIQIQIYRQICVKHSKTKLFYTALFIYQSLCVYHFTAVIFFIFFSLCFFQETVFCLKLTLNLSFNINRLVINFLKFDTLKVYFTFQLAGCLCWREKSRLSCYLLVTSLMAQTVKLLSTMQETRVQSLGLRRFPWRRKWQSTPGLLPGKPMDRGDWQAIVHGVAKSRT